MFGRTLNTECLVRENGLNGCEVGNVDDDDDDDDNEEEEEEEKKKNKKNKNKLSVLLVG
jgi:TATA-binding protein-associated factor Taf7